MTSWTPPRPVTPLRVLPIVLLALVGPWVGAVVGFVGIVEITGCLLGCDGSTNVPLGLGLLAAAVAVLAAAPALAWVLLRSARAVGWTVGGMILALGVPALLGKAVAGAGTIAG